MAFNMGDLLFQVFSLLFIAFTVTIIVIAFRMIRRKRMELKKRSKRVKNPGVNRIFLFSSRFLDAAASKRKRHLKEQADRQAFGAA